MAKNKYAKLRVQITIEFFGKSDKTGQKLKAKLEKLMNKKGIQMFGISVTTPPDVAVKPAKPFKESKASKRFSMNDPALHAN
jgi:hypothetical protein